MAIEDLSPWLRDNLEAIEAAGNKGIECPCCTGRIAIRKQKITRKMAQFLTRLVQLYSAEQKMCSTRQILNVESEKVSTDGAYFTYWGLVEKGNPAHMNKKGTYYAPTALGIAFVCGDVKVPDRKDILMGVELRSSEELIDIWEALQVPHGFEHLLGESPE